TTLLQKELNVKSERQKSTVFYKELAGSVDNLSESSDDEEEIEEKLQWIAFKQHFFSAILTSEQALNNTALAVTTDPSEQVVKHYKADAHLEFSSKQDNQYAFNFF